jgi:hypothetical protein
MQKVLDALTTKALAHMIHRSDATGDKVYDQDSVDRLRRTVEKYSYCRDFFRNQTENIETALKISDELVPLCDFYRFYGEHRNVIAGWGDDSLEGKIIIGGHYDSPGADDNGSAIAVLLELAYQLRDHKPGNVLLAFFNGEEYGLLGSQEFVAGIESCRAAIILEMVGYFTDKPGSQSLPAGFPDVGLSVGNFLAVIGNQYSGSIGKELLAAASGSCLPVTEFKIPLGLESSIPGLMNVERSDHKPFWDRKLPAVMLTDTAEFRNRKYHQKSYLPDTLNYEAISKVVEVLKNYVLFKTVENVG